MTTKQKLKYLLEAMTASFKGMGTAMKRHALSEIDDEALLTLLEQDANKIRKALIHIRKQRKTHD